jgi:hypothetical protein
MRAHGVRCRVQVSQCLLRMLNCVEQRIRVVARARREYERINPKADFGRGYWAREEAMLGTVTNVKPDDVSLAIDAVGSGANAARRSIIAA